MNGEEKRLGNIRHLIKRELLRDRLGLVAGLIINIVFSVLAVALMEAADNVVKAVLRDVFFLSIIGTLGYSLMAREYRSYWWNTRPVTKKLIFLKSLPVSTAEIVYSRTIIFLLTVVVTGAAFFIAFNLGWQMEDVPIPLKEKISYSLVWMSYAIGIGSVYLWMELSLKEKAYFIGCFVFLGIFLMLAVILQLAGTSLIDLILEGNRQYGAIVPLASIAVSIIVCLVSVKAAVRGLERRDLA